MKYYVFIDTCIYKSMRYQFDNNESLIMDLLKSQVDMNKIEILMPIITKMEIENHLNPKIDDVICSINTAIRNATKDYPWIMESGYEYVTSGLINQSGLSVFNNFIKKYKCKILSYNYSNIEKVFEDYFNNVFPFENNKRKKCEFPDAFSIDIIKNFLDFDYSKLIVVTTDLGVKKSFPSDVLIFSSINELLAFLNSNNESNKDINLHLRRISVTKHDEIICKIQKHMGMMKCQLINVPPHENSIILNPDNVYIHSAYDYNLIGKKDDVVYVSITAIYFIELVIKDVEGVDSSYRYYYDGKMVYDFEIKIIGIDAYQILNIKNSLYTDTFILDYVKLGKHSILY